MFEEITQDELLDALSAFQTLAVEDDAAEADIISRGVTTKEIGELLELRTYPKRAEARNVLMGANLLEPVTNLPRPSAFGNMRVKGMVFTAKFKEGIASQDVSGWPVEAKALVKAMAEKATAV